LDGDGKAEIVLGDLAGRLVRVLNGNGLVLRAFPPYPIATGGISVSVGDVDGDGRAEIITGANAMQDSIINPMVASVVFQKLVPFRVLDGRTGAVRMQALPAGLALSGLRARVPFAAIDRDEDGISELLLGVAPGTLSLLRLLAWPSGVDLGGLPVIRGMGDGV